MKDVEDLLQWESLRVESPDELLTSIRYEDRFSAEEYSADKI